MRIKNKQFNLYQWLVNNEPLVILGYRKKRDAGANYHRRDGPIFETGPPDKTGFPQATVSSYMTSRPNGTGPPRTGVG